MRERGNFAFSDNVDECWEYEEIPKQKNQVLRGCVCSNLSSSALRKGCLLCRWGAILEQKGQPLTSIGEVSPLQNDSAQPEATILNKVQVVASCVWTEANRSYLPTVAISGCPVVWQVSRPSQVPYSGYRKHLAKEFTRESAGTGECNSSYKLCLNQRVSKLQVLVRTKVEPSHQGGQQALGQAQEKYRMLTSCQLGHQMSTARAMTKWTRE